MPTILYLEMKLGDFVTGGNLRGYVTSLKFFMNSDERDSKKSLTLFNVCVPPVNVTHLFQSLL